MLNPHTFSGEPLLFQGKLLYYIVFPVYSSFKIDFIIVSLAKAILITIIHTIRINLPSHFGYAILIIIDILQQKLKISLCRTTKRNPNDRFWLNRPLS